MNRLLLRYLVALVALVATTGALMACTTSASNAITSVPGDRAGIATGGPFLWSDDATLAADLDAIAATGAKWIRFDFDWPSIEPLPGARNWQHTDRVVAAARARGLHIIALLAYTPEWARPAGTTSRHPPTNVDHFATFARLAAERYRDHGVSVFEVWNEPNVASFWEPRPDAAAYAQLLRATTTGIRSTQPGATVLTGSTAPAADRADGLSVAPLTFVRQLYDLGAAPWFDAIGIHPYTFPIRPHESVPWNPFVQALEIRALMVARSDSAKTVWATEYGAPTGSSSVAVSPVTQAEMIGQAFAVWEQWRAWTGPLLVYNHRDYGTNPADPEQNFGLRTHNGAAKPAYELFTRLIAGSATSAPAPTPESTPVPAPASTTVAPEPTANVSRMPMWWRNVIRQAPRVGTPTR